MCGIQMFVVLVLMAYSCVRADVSHVAPSSNQFYPYQPRQYQQQQLAKQFSAPELEHAAFTQVLTSRGYVFGGPAAAAAATAQAANLPRPRTLSAAAAAAAHAEGNSLNLKLPVPFGLMPLNVAQLPLQAGAPYALVPRTTGLTSYGTAQIQR
ncbi:CG13046 [Drosophila busckii]|uniref:CG13046 n=1 Tax=Drosophila busckii TaxID=30019 RepID=A0A0M4EKU9_DROBS|nr:uncharacterized protein LOC108599698 [Drosophila busckii]ALC43947.1 CG13046 [Drosophila busckii]